jgi:hypothetical protein
MSEWDQKARRCNSAGLSSFLILSTAFAAPSMPARALARAVAFGLKDSVDGTSLAADLIKAFVLPPHHVHVKPLGKLPRECLFRSGVTSGDFGIGK